MENYTCDLGVFLLAMSALIIGCWGDFMREMAMPEEEENK